MLILEPRHVFMHQSAIDKPTALVRLSEILQQEHLATDQYLLGLQQREQQSATYLGQGIAIPHGTPESRQEILQTGVRLVHFPQGVVWTESGDIVYLAVVIAAKSDEHLQVLQLLTKALGEADLAEALQTAQTAEQVLALLQATTPSLLLHERLILTDVVAQDIDDVLIQAGRLLKQADCVQAGFISGLNVETAVQLQAGVWCVTGQYFVAQSAVSIVHLAEEIDFVQGKKSHRLKTLLCIASDQHIQQDKLTQFIQLLLQVDTQHWQNPSQIAQEIGAELIPQWRNCSVVLANAHGLHARPATALAKFCQQFAGEILLSVNGGVVVSAKSLTKLLSLGAVRGQTLTFMVEPETLAEQHLADIVDFVQQGLGEAVEPIVETPISSFDYADNSYNSTVAEIVQTEVLSPDVAYKGVPASSGLAVGVVHLVTPQQFDFEKISQKSADDEWQDLQSAISQVQQQLQILIEHAKTSDIANIFTAHMAMMSDDELLSNVKQWIMQQNFTAAAAWQQCIEQLAESQAKLENTLLAERAADFRDIGQRVLAVLCGQVVVSEPDEPYILVKDDLMPSDVAQLDRAKVAGILTAVGGASSHSAIVARALAIPAIVGAGERILNIEQGMTVLLDGESGDFYIQPNAERVAQALSLQQQQAELQEKALQSCHLPAITLDHHQVEVAANLGDVHDTAKAVNLGAEAIGLLRTELVFMSHSSAPSEQQQEQDYRIVFDGLAGRPLVVRTLDVGGDKPLPYVPMPKEENPFLGVRGMRLTLRKPELLRTQLRALIRSADHRPLRIMFPMIGRVEEWREAKAILDEVLQEMPCDNLQVGMMIEVPSAVLLAPILAKEVDFFSIGTNDLTQYVLAIDRGHPELSSEADALHPSILLMIHHTLKFAHRYGKWVGVCGELANDRLAVPILLGLGVDELSMSASRIALVKSQIRSLNFEQCQVMAKRSLDCATANDVRQLSAEFLAQLDTTA